MYHIFLSILVHEHEWSWTENILTSQTHVVYTHMNDGGGEKEEGGDILAQHYMRLRHLIRSLSRMKYDCPRLFVVRLFVQRQSLFTKFVSCRVVMTLFQYIRYDLRSGVHYYSRHPLICIGT